MRRQQGVALLLMFLALFVAASAVVLTRLPPDPHRRQREETVRQLQRAKEALLAYAVTYEDNYINPLTPNYPPPGYLPCPNLDLPAKNESPNPPCHTHAPIIGRLPRDFPAGPGGNVFETFTAGSRQGEEFWYALSRGFQNNHPPLVLNATSPALLMVDGQPSVAVILAPGVPLQGQRRPSTDARDYLEGENADGDNDYTTGGDSNDTLLFITRPEFATRLTERVAADLKKVLDPLFDRDGRYPAELPAGLPDWYAENWGAVTHYVSTGDTATLRFDGCGITWTLVRGRPVATKDKASCG